MDNNQLSTINLIDTDQFMADVRVVKKELEGIGESVKKISEKGKGGIGSSLSKEIGSLFSTDNLKAFASEVVRVRSEVSMLEKSFEVLLGSKSKSDAMLSGMKDVALKSPLSMDELSEAAKKLLQFNVDAESVVPLLSQIGDVAMGSGGDFTSLAEAFGQISADGKLTEQSLSQMVGAGFNPLLVIADQTGKSLETLNGEMLSGAISSEMITGAFAAATGEGGKFHGMMESQMTGIAGAQKRLEGAITDTLNAIGESQEGLIAGSYDAATWIVENYQSIGKVVVELVALYGIYKAALIVNTVIERRAAVARLLQITYTHALTVAQAALNAVMMMNPAVLVGAGIAALAVSMWALSDSTSAAEKSQKKFNDEQERFKAQADEKKQKVEGLIRTIQDETETEAAKGKAYRDLQELSPELVKAYDLETLKTLELSKAQKVLNQERDDADYQNSLTKVSEITAKIGEQKNSQILPENQEPGTQYWIKKRIEELELDLQKYREKIKEHQEWLKNNEPVEVKLSEAKADLEQIEKEFRLAEQRYNEEKQKLAEGTSLIIPFYIQLEYENLDKQKEEMEDKVSKLLKQMGAGKSYKDYVKRAVDDIKKADAEIEKQTKDGVVTDTATILEARKGASDARSVYKGLTGKDYGEKKDDSAEKKQEELDKQLLADRQKLNGELISLMEEGRLKRLQQSEKEYLDQKALLNENQTKIEKEYEKLGKKMPKEVTETHEKRSEANEKAYKKRDEKIDEESKKEFADLQKRMTNVFLSEEQIRQQTLKERYDKEREWVERQRESKNITDEQAKGYNTEIGNAEAKENLKSLQSAANDFKSKYDDLSKEWDDKIATSVNSGNTSLTAKLEEGKGKALSKLNSQMLMESSDWLRLFGNLDTLTVDELDNLITSIENKMNDTRFELNGIDVQPVLDGLSKAKEQIAEKSPFTALASSSKEMKTALAALKKAEEDGYEGTALDVYKEKVAAAANNVQKAVGKIGSAYGEVRDVMNQAADLISMVDEGLGDTIKNALSMGDAVMSIGDVVSGAVAGFSKGMTAMETASVILLAIKAVITIVMTAIKLFNNDKKHEQKIEELQGQIDVLERSYDKLGKAIEQAFSNDASQLIGDQNKLLEQQKILIQNQIKEEEAKKKSDSGKIQDWKNQLEDIDATIGENKQKAVDAIFGADLKSAIDEFAQAYADAWAVGEDKATAVKDVVKNMIKGVIMEMLKADLGKAVEKVRETIATAMFGKADQYGARSGGDGIIDAAEKAAIDKLVDDAVTSTERKYGGLDDYMKEDGEKETSQESSKGGFESMSQDSADELNGRFTALQIAGEELKFQSGQQSAYLLGMSVNLDVVKLYTQGIAVSVSEMKDIALTSMNHLSTIEKNTRQLYQMNERLGNIERNTKGL